MCPPLKLGRVSGLATVAAPPLCLLVTAHAGAQRNVDAWRRCKSEALGHLDEIQLVDVKHRAQRVRRVRLEIGAVTILGRLDAVDSGQPDRTATSRDTNSVSSPYSDSNSVQSISPAAIAH